MADKDLSAQQEARDAVEAAHGAFLSLRGFSQQKVDSICESMASAALRESARLGEMAASETGFGVADDKREKNRFAAEDVWNHFRDLKTVGVVGEAESIVEIASPRGVVAAIIPSTNPTSTTIFKIIISIKSRNSVVISPHPAAAKSIAETAAIMKSVAISNGLPADAIRVLTRPSLEGTNDLMKHRKTAVILATGGPGLVRAAYSSGKPAFGVGPGNVPVFVERSADVAKAAADILTGTCFDNGTICASEQSVVADRQIEAQLRAEFTARGGHFLSAEEASAVGKVLVTAEGKLNAGIVGKSAQFIADQAGISIPGNTRCLIADCLGIGREYPWSVEKLSPTLAFFVVDNLKEGADTCRRVLEFGGMGHTAGMHTADRSAAVEFGSEMPASRIVINSPTTHGAIGFSTDLDPSMTLGCGSWGGNVTSDNVSPHHLMDIKRVAFETKPVSLVDSGSRGSTSVDASEKRAKIAKLVDSFLSERLPQSTPAPMNVERQDTQKPVTKAVVHRIDATPQVSKTAVEFVAEIDVREAFEKGEKIIVNDKTIITPAAIDLGNEKDVFEKI